MTDEIELRNAYAWDCPGCGYTNVVEQWAKEIEFPEPIISDSGEFEFTHQIESGPRCGERLACHRCEAIYFRKLPEIEEN